jgi:anti-sigma factor RsiW
MIDHVAELHRAKDDLIGALASALDSGVSLAECLAALGVEGKPATMLRAFLSRYSDADLAATLREMQTSNPSVEGLGVEAP